MKTLVAGRSPELDAAAAALYSELGTEIGRLAHVREALTHPTTERLAVVAPLLQEDDIALLPALVARGVSLVLLSDVAAVELRSRALSQGAIDVLFPPIIASRIVSALDPRPAGGMRRAQFRATLQPREGTTFEGTCALLSTQHVELEIADRRPQPGDSFRAVLHGPQSFTAWIRVTETLPLGAEGSRVTARFLGLTGDESAALVDLVDGLPSIAENLVRILRVVDRLDMDKLGQPSDVRLPALLDIERDGLARGDGAIGSAAVSRIGALLLGDVLEVDAAAAGLARVAALIDSAGDAQEELRSIAALAELNDHTKLAGVRDLQKRLANAMERVQQHANVAAKEAPVMRALPPTLWDRIEPRTRWALFAGGAIAIALGVIGLLELMSKR